MTFEYQIIASVLAL